MIIPKITALVPMKGHSERVPHKNIRQLVDRPACHWVLGKLNDCKYIDEIIVDTDDGTDGIQNAGVATLTFAMDWIWNYQNLGDITAYVTAYKADNNGASTADAITAFNAESAATKATYLTEASAHANDAFDTALGEAAFAKANGGTDTTGDIQLSVHVDATQVD